MDKLTVGKFVPVTPSHLAVYQGSEKYLHGIFGVVPHYTGRGRWALAHCIQSGKIHNILIPSYICSSILDGLKKGGVDWGYYDLDCRDLNADCESIRHRLSEKKYDAVLVASMYGNPAAMTEIEEICKMHSVLLIDDAAQSFGAKLDGRSIGSFGDYGFLSFSPGKPTVAHMGAFYWTNSSKEISERKYKKHRFIMHLLRYKSFIAMRRDYYSHDVTFYDRLINKLGYLLEKTMDSYRDDNLPFENRYLEEVLVNEDIYSIQMRNERFRYFEDQVEESNFRIIKSIRGNPNPHKIVLVFDSELDKKVFSTYLLNKGIYNQDGYRGLDRYGEYCPNSYSIQDLLLELPIDGSMEKFLYMVDAIRCMKKVC